MHLKKNKTCLIAWLQVKANDLPDAMLTGQYLFHFWILALPFLYRSSQY